jgi:hypothetical protein
LPSVRAIGTPKRAAGEHTRKSHASAIAQPPPAAIPSTCAMVVTATRSSRDTQASRRCSYSTPSWRVENEVNWLMSVPGQNVAPAGANDEYSNVGRLVDALAGLDERVVHRPGHRVPGLGPVDGEEGNRTTNHEDSR